MTDDLAVDNDGRVAAVRRLYGLMNGAPLLPEDELPPEFADYASETNAVGMDLQLGVLALWIDAGEQIGGWKLPSPLPPGAPTPPGPPDPLAPFGYILASRIAPSPATIQASAIPSCVIEAEVALRIGERLAGEVTSGQVRAAISAWTPAFEICSFRVPRTTPRVIRVADALSSWGLVLGEDQTSEVDMAAIQAQMWRDGESLGVSAAGLGLLVGAYEAVAGMARVLGERGMALEAGQRVTLGSMLAPTPVGDATEFTADYGALGTISVRTA